MKILESSTPLDKDAVLGDYIVCRVDSGDSFETIAADLGSSTTNIESTYLVWKEKTRNKDRPIK